MSIGISCVVQRKWLSILTFGSNYSIITLIQHIVLCRSVLFPCSTVRSAIPDFLSHLAESIESEIVERFWHSRCLHNHIDLPNMIGTLAMAPIPPWWPKVELKFFSTTIDKINTGRQIFVFEVSKWPYLSPPHDRITCMWCH